MNLTTAMTRKTFQLCAWLIFASGFAACSGSDGIPEPPIAEERGTPGTVAPDYSRMDATMLDVRVGTYDGNHERVECCMVDFAFPDDTDDERIARLRGGSPPLDGEGVTLAYSDGAWRAAACLRPDYDDIYYYEFGLISDADRPGANAGAGDAGAVDASARDAGVFYTRRANPQAPIVDDIALGSVNYFVLVDSCDDVDLDAHNASNEPDRCDKGYFGDDCGEYLSINGKPALVWLPLDEGAGAELGDRTSNDLDGTATNGTWVTDGRVAGESVLSFDGTGRAEVAFPAQADGDPAGNLFIPQGDVTFSMWFRTSNASVEGLMHVYGSMGGCDRPVGGDGTTLSANIWDEVNIDGSVVVNDGAWHHMAYVLEQGAGIYLYVDGQLDASSAVATNNCGVGCSGFNAADRFVVGDGGQCRFGAGSFVGDIDDISMWQGALSVSEIQALHENQQPN